MYDQRLIYLGLFFCLIILASYMILDSAVQKKKQIVSLIDANDYNAACHLLNIPSPCKCGKENENYYCSFGGKDLDFNLSNLLASEK